jgi:hypothetical protein
MNTTTPGYLVICGVFLSLLGIIGYLTHPEKAITARISGGTFGGLSIPWGILSAKGLRWSRLAALLTTALLSVACVWCIGLGWMAVAKGQSGKGFATLLITLMLAVSVVMLVMLLKDRKPGDTGKPAEEMP